MKNDQKNLARVSIITVCYNSADSLENTIQSVLRQTYPNIEYIIIDGGSTDSTVDLIKKYEDKIAYWVSEKDNGISDAFNKGIRHATGAIIGIINSDDWYADDAVQLAVDAFNEGNVGFVFGDMVNTDSDGYEVFKQKGDSKYITSINHTMSTILHPTVFIGKPIYEKYGCYDINLRVAMDYELILRIVKNGVKGKCIPANIAFMRAGGKSDMNYATVYAEVRDVSIKYGYPRITAWCRYLVRVTKTLLKKKLEQKDLHRIIKVIRKMTNKKRYGYSD